METLSLDYEGIVAYQKNRYPYLLIDRATAVVPGRSATGFKNLTVNEWFFDCHFPGDPNMPGLLQVESLVQLSALILLTLPGHKGMVAYLTSSKNVKIARKIIPGDRLDITSELVTWKRGIGTFSATSSVSGEAACSAEFQLVLPDILKQYKVVAASEK